MFLNSLQSHHLKDLKFRDKCYAYWTTHLSSEKDELKVGEIDSSLYERMSIPEDFHYLAPTYEQFFEWCRKEYRYNGWISPLLNTDEYHYHIQNPKKPFLIIKSNDSNSDYNYVRDQLVNKLIEIIKIELETEKDVDY